MSKLQDKSRKRRADGSARRRKELKKVEIVDLHATFGINNTIITVSDITGAKIFQLSPPTLGFKGPKKPTPYAAQAVMQAVIKRAKEDHKAVAVRAVFVSGPGPGRDVALRSIKLPVSSIIDITPEPHNGCRPVGARSS